MKYMNVVKRFGVLNLQIFADDGGDGDPDGNEGDDGAEDDDPDGDGDEDPEEKKFSQKDVDEAVKKRLARERRKWQRNQQKKKEPDSRAKSAGDDDGEDEAAKTLREKAEKADELELKWACLEHDVDKSYVDDVLALAKTRMIKDEELDIEDAIEEVLKKYPHFKESSKKEDDEDGAKGKSWGERQREQRKRTSGVEAAFLKKNPGLKID